MEAVKIIETSKKKPCAVHRGFQYRVQRIFKNGNITWLCLNERSQKCKGRLLTNSEHKLLNKSEHVCKSNEAAVEVREMICTIKKRVREVDGPISNVYREEFEALCTKRYDFVAEIPGYKSVQRSLQRIRREKRNIPASLRKVSRN